MPTKAELLKDLSLYHRTPGTEQCLESIEVREAGGMRHWAVCFREKFHPGPHRHWIPVDWKNNNETLTLKRGRKVGKDKR